MQRLTRVFAGSALVLTGSLGVWVSPASTPAAATLSAGSIQPTADSDGDNLPDLLEHVAFSDPSLADTDGDGRDDFLEVVEHTSPIVKDPSRARSNAFRVLVNSSEEPHGQRFLWVHVLLRVGSGLVTDVSGLSLFVDFKGERCSLDPIFAFALAEVVQRLDATRGLFLRFSLRLPVSPALESLSPVTFGGYCLVRSSLMASGAILVNQGGDLFTLSPLGSSLILQAANPIQSSSPFWSTNKACMLSLQVQAASRIGLLCEVQKASCEVSQTMRCVPDCSAMKGHTLVVPDGLSLILGG